MADLSRDDIEESVVTSHEPKKVAGSVVSEKHSDIEIHQEPDDGLYEGLEFPSEHEMATLRRVPDTIPLNTYRESTTVSISVSTIYSMFV